MALTDNIVGCWSPSVRGSGYLLPDLSGGGNHGTLTNMAGDDWVGASVRGVSGKALSYDGSNDYVRANCPQPLKYNSTKFTLFAWVSVAAGYHKLLQSGGLQLIWYIATVGNLNGGSQIAIGGVYSGGTIASNTRLTANTWSLIGFSWNEPTVQFYLNGKSDGSKTVSGSPSFGVFDWGGTGGVETTNGNVSECCVWNRVLTDAEVSEYYRRGNGAVGRELTGQTRRRVYGFVPAGFRAYWVRQQSRVIGGGV